MRPLRIAQVAPLFESVPPKFYGGTERVVSYLTEQLVAMSQEVTLFASGDSVTAARLIPPCGKSLRLDHALADYMPYQVLLLEKIFQHADEFDVVHFHTDYMHFPYSRRQSMPVLTTLHGRLDLPDLVPIFDEFRDMPLTSISDSQRRPLPRANWRSTVYHGLPTDLFRFQEEPENYLAFLGRLSPEKRVDRAIEIAGRAGMKLRIAAKIDAADRSYFESEVAPLMRLPHVEYLGEINEKEKGPLLGGAQALLFPIDWPEPFGLVMIESMACGTPVIAFRGGSVDEVMDEGVTGFIVESVDEAVKAVERIPEISRRRCRDVFESRFSAERMARDYLAVYENMVTHEQPSAAAMDA
ncbi:MAG TPA: glycosyltransferase family 4 protein [Phycisphaerae bacterium]|nr:glycosyltransferase family 4 protein [Phycisphaerae bacterium]